MHLNDPITCLPAVGEKRARLFHRLGIFTVQHLIEHYPRDFKDKSEAVKIAQLKTGESATVLCVADHIWENIRIKSKTLTRVRLKDETGAIEAIWFNMPYMRKNLNQGESYYFTGKVQKRFQKISLLTPSIEKKEHPHNIGRIIPVYPSTAGLSQKIIQKTIEAALKQCGPLIQENLPGSILAQYQLMGKGPSIENIHFPEDPESFVQARKRLVFEELFLSQTALLRLRHRYTKEIKGIRFKHFEALKDFFNSLPYRLTNAQHKVMEEIITDLQSEYSMNRLVQGDVGSGKTILAMAACYLAAKNACQAAFMAPTEVLALQHYDSFQSVLEPLGIHIVLLTGSLTKKEREERNLKVREGFYQVVIGTHAVIQKSVIFQRLGLVITDEQHRFGVAQRMKLSEKGDNPNALVMTATPIPRTLALVLYGDLDISIIDEMPPGRKEIGTWAVDEGYRQRIYRFIEKELAQGRQAYAVCPIIERQEETGENIITVLEYADKLKKEFHSYQVACLHGKMKAEEKQRLLDDFYKGKIHMLVATTVIEVGINVPNATIMLVENAERFGLSQLHQLRGRVGRGSYQSHCILIYSGDSDKINARMKIMAQTNDGFQIAEKDLELRGSGDFFGTRQHGLPDFKIANLYRDINVLKLAQQAAENILQKDPDLKLSENLILQEQINGLFVDNKDGVYL